MDFTKNKSRIFFLAITILVGACVLSGCKQQNTSTVPAEDIVSSSSTVTEPLDQDLDSEQTLDEKMNTLPGDGRPSYREVIQVSKDFVTALTNGDTEALKTFMREDVVQGYDLNLFDDYKSCLEFLDNPDASDFLRMIFAGVEIQESMERQNSEVDSYLEIYEQNEDFVSCVPYIGIQANNIYSSCIPLSIRVYGQMEGDKIYYPETDEDAKNAWNSITSPALSPSLVFAYLDHSGNVYFDIPGIIESSTGVRWTKIENAINDQKTFEYLGKRRSLLQLLIPQICNDYLDYNAGEYRDVGTDKPDLDIVASGEIYECTDNHFQEAYSRELTNEEIALWNEALQNLTEDGERINRPFQYYLHLYDADGMAVIYLLIDEDKKVYTEIGTEVSNVPESLLDSMLKGADSDEQPYVC